MTTTFTASNGIEIEISQERYLIGIGDYGSGPTYATGGPEGIDALREYFQNERDAELGRWRSEEHPNYVVYPVAEWPDAIDIMNESTATSHRCAPGCVHLGPDTFKWGAVKDEYFAAHPEPKPWHSAEVGTLWRITAGALGKTRLAIAHEDATFTDHDGIGWKADEITHATRIWPTEETDR